MTKTVSIQAGRAPGTLGPSLSIPDPCIVNSRKVSRQACSQDPKRQAALLSVPNLGEGCQGRGELG